MTAIPIMWYAVFDFEHEKFPDEESTEYTEYGCKSIEDSMNLKSESSPEVI